jgi:hypothetical protein
MKRSEFFEFLTRFSEQPIPATIYRHMYIWVGEVEDLLSKSPAGFIKKIDLHVLCGNLTKTPLGDKAAGRELSDGIDQWLLKEFPASQRQRALLVTGIDLLYRYHMPLSTFMHLANENCMVILCLSALDANFRPANPLPSFIQFSPYAILKYAASEIPEEAIVKEE